MAMILPEAMNDDVVVIARVLFQPRTDSAVVAEATPTWTNCMNRQCISRNVGLSWVIEAENLDLVPKILKKKPPLPDAFDGSSATRIDR